MKKYLRTIKEYTFQLQQLLEQNPSEFNSELKNKLPKESGIYGIFEKDIDKNVYIGESKNIQKRVCEDLFQANCSAVENPDIAIRE